MTTTERAKATLTAALPLVAMVVGVKLVWSDVTWGTVLGGTIEGNNAARADGWPRILAFARKVLAQRP